MHPYKYLVTPQLPYQTQVLSRQPWCSRTKGMSEGTASQAPRHASHCMPDLPPPAPIHQQPVNEQVSQNTYGQADGTDVAQFFGAIIIVVHRSAPAVDGVVGLGRDGDGGR